MSKVLDNDARVRAVEVGIKRLQERIDRLEEEMSVVLRFMRFQAEAEAKKRNPFYVTIDDAKA